VSGSVPQVLGAYQLKGKLAVGGQSEVWLAVRRGPGGFRRRCALKLVLPPTSLDDVARKNFFAEARLMAQFDHPNLVAVTDLGEDQEHEILYSVMPYVSGRSLASILRDFPDSFRAPDLLWFGSRVLMALGYAHQMRDEKGRLLHVIHRDISPENILIGFDGQVRLVDFGIALSSINPRSTRMHVVKGKLEYLSPEQASASPHIDGTTDIYSAGLVFYSVLTGHNPLAGDPDTALARARRPRITRLRDIVDVPVELDELIHQMLDVNPAARPNNAFGLAAAFLKTLRKCAPGYEEIDFAGRVGEMLESYWAGEREFLMDHLAEGTQVIDTRAFTDREPTTSPIPPTKPSRRKTLPARPEQRTPLDVESVSREPGDGLADIFRELEEIYDD